MASNNKNNTDLQTEFSATGESFEYIYRKYWSELYLYAYNILRDQDKAKDVIQEVFITLLKTEKINGIDNIRAFLIQSVKYQIYNLVRAEKVRLRAFEQLSFFDYDNLTSERLQEKELRQQIAQSVSNLPDKCRTIFSLRQEGHTVKAIATLTGLSPRTVEHQIYLAVKKLRYSLKSLITSGILILAFLRP